MKAESDRAKRRRQSKALAGKSLCGTLSYRAECRGMELKALSPRKQVPPEVADRIFRNFTAWT